MNRLLIVAAFSLIALPGSAQESASNQSPKPSEKQSKSTAATSAPVAAPGAQAAHRLDAGSVPGADSPMVAAAKRANRSSKKPALVITNENLSKYQSAHWTTTEAQEPIPQSAATTASAPAPAPAPKASAHAPEKKEEPKLDPKKKAETERRRREAAQAANEEGFLETPPDEAEAAQHDASKPLEEQRIAPHETPKP